MAAALRSFTAAMRPPAPGVAAKTRPRPVSLLAGPDVGEEERQEDERGGEERGRRGGRDEKGDERGRGNADDEERAEPQRHEEVGEGGGEEARPFAAPSAGTTTSRSRAETGRRSAESRETSDAFVEAEARRRAGSKRSKARSATGRSASGGRKASALLPSIPAEKPKPGKTTAAPCCGVRRPQPIDIEPDPVTRWISVIRKPSPFQSSAAAYGRVQPLVRVAEEDRHREGHDPDEEVRHVAEAPREERDALEEEGERRDGQERRERDDEEVREEDERLERRLAVDDLHRHDDDGEGERHDGEERDVPEELAEEVLAVPSPGWRRGEGPPPPGGRGRSRSTPRRSRRGRGGTAGAPPSPRRARRTCRRPGVRRSRGSPARSEGRGTSSRPPRGGGRGRRASPAAAGGR